MAQRRWFANDGQTHFDTKAQANEFDARHDMVKRVAEIANGTPETILKWFEENFRVAKPRVPRKSKVAPVPVAVSPVFPTPSATAATVASVSVEDQKKKAVK